MSESVQLQKLRLEGRGGGGGGYANNISKIPKLQIFFFIADFSIDFNSLC